MWWWNERAQQKFWISRSINMYCVSILKSKACNLGAKLSTQAAQKRCKMQAGIYAVNGPHTVCVRTPFLENQIPWSCQIPRDALVSNHMWFCLLSFVLPFSHFLLCFIIFLQSSVVGGISFALVFSLQVNSPWYGFIPDYICPIISHLQYLFMVSCFFFTSINTSSSYWICNQPFPLSACNFPIVKCKIVSPAASVVNNPV